MAELHHQHRRTDITHTQNRPSSSQVAAVVTLFPVGGILLTLAGLTLAGTLIGLTVAAPLFLIFSPILVPAVLAIAVAVAGFITSGAFGITALSSISWIINYVRRMKGSWAEQLDQVGRHVQDTAAHVGQRAREGGQKGRDVVRP